MKDNMRWLLGFISLAAATFFWFMSVAVSPYATWGVDEVRREEAGFSVNFALASLAFQLVAALIVFWEKEGRWKKRRIAFAAVLAFFALTLIYRIIWIEFVVLV